MQSNSSALSVSLLIILYLIFFHVENKSTYDEKIVYTAMCSDSIHDIFSCPSDHMVLILKKGYNVSIEKQDVIEKDLFSQEKFESCYVYNKDNWECVTKHGSGFLMRDGNYHVGFSDGSGKALDKNGKESSYPLQKQISFIEYIVRKTLQLF